MRRRGEICKETGQGGNQSGSRPGEARCGAAGPQRQSQDGGAPGPRWSAGYPHLPSVEQQLVLLHNANMVDKENLAGVWRLNPAAPFHAGDARVSAGPCWNLCWGAQRTGEPLQTRTPRFFQRTRAGPLRPLTLEEARKVGSETWMAAPSERPAELSAPSRTGPASAPRRVQPRPLVARMRTTCRLRQSGTNALVSRERRRPVSVALAPPPPPRSLPSPKPVALLRSSLSGSLRRRRLEEPLWERYTRKATSSSRPDPAGAAVA